MELCTRVPVFLGGGPGLCCVCHWYMSVGLFWESLHLGCVWVFTVFAEGSCICGFFGDPAVGCPSVLALPC